MQKQEPQFRTKILNSVKLSTLRFGSDIALRLISTVVLTRLLAPEVYGVFAIVLVYVYLLDMFSDFGLRSLVLTKEGEAEDEFLRTCWTVSILRGVAIAALSALIALVIWQLQRAGVFAAQSPYVAPALPLAIAALGAGSLINGFQSPMRFMSERQMQFGRVTMVDVIRNVVALVVTIALAFYLRSIWALVLGNVAKALVHVTLSFVVFRGPQMRLALHRASLVLLVDRGKWIVGHSILTALSQAADRLVLGFVMSSSTFGFYFIARQLVDMVLRFLEAINAQMGLQVFTHIQKSTVADFRRNYYRYRLLFDALAGLSAGGMLVLSPLLVEIVFDDRYADIAPMMQVLVPGLLLVGPMVLRSAFSAERRFKRMTYLSVISTGTLVLGLLVAVFVFDSVVMALLVIALHRLPEALLLMAQGWTRDWVILWREGLGLVFCGLGAGLGYAVLQLWQVLT